jgi:IS30 family transposase
MGRSNSTISRELSRNTGNRGYRHKQANNLACEQYQQKNKHSTYDVNSRLLNLQMSRGITL